MQDVLVILAAILVCGSAVWGQPSAVSASGAQGAVIDDQGYADDASARKAWQPMEGTAGVSVVQRDGGKALKMPCNFKGTKIERASWDRSVRLDLTTARRIEFEFLCEDLSPVGQFSFYLHSPGGWYTAGFGAGAGPGWTTVRIEKTEMNVEGSPAGWGQIDTIRISAWRGGDTDTAFYIRGLKVVGGSASILVIRGESAAKTARGELASVNEYTRTVSDRLDELGLGFSVISDLEVTADRLKGRKLVILPQNPQMPDATADALEKYLQDGGKLLAFYSLPGKLRAVTGIEGGRHVPQQYRGYFASIRPVKDPPIRDMPAVTPQMSWNILDVKPVQGRSRIAAEWYDKDGNSTGLPAVIASDNCVYMTHVLLADDPPSKRRLLIALVGALVPDAWRQAAEASIDNIGRVGPYQGLTDARKRTNLGAGSSHSAVFKMEEAQDLLGKAKSLCAEKRFAEAVAAAEEANRRVLEAICMVQQSAKGEHRAFWCHSAFGVGGMEWDEAIKALADNGFTAIVPNMLWGGAAFYQSKVLPVAPEVNQKGDQIAKCLAACRKYGVACHVWKVNWNLGWNAPKDFVAKLREQNRLQVDFSGKGMDWLCPSHPDNQKLEIDSMVEVATNYDVDGIHFDYIRYPGPESCFCTGCRERFEKAAGAKVANWPADLRRDSDLHRKWLDFRRANITTVVAAVSEAVRKDRPKVKISAAVFGNWPVDRDGVAQDWKLWCQNGYLDFVCPMDYTPQTGQFRSLVQRQVQWAGKVPCYPGIGYSTWGSKGDIFTLFDQIDVTRQAKTGGFTIFEYNAGSAKDILPLCGMGITRLGTSH